MCGGEYERAARVRDCSAAPLIRICAGAPGDRCPYRKHLKRRPRRSSFRLSPRQAATGCSAGCDQTSAMREPRPADRTERQLGQTTM